MDEQEFRLSVQDKNSSIKQLIKQNKKFIKNFKNFIITMGKYGSYHISKILAYIVQLFTLHLKTQQEVETFFFLFI